MSRYRFNASRRTYHRVSASTSNSFWVFIGYLIGWAIVLGIIAGAVWCIFSLLAFAWNEVIVGKFWLTGPSMEWWHMLLGGIVITWIFRLMRK